MHHHYLSYNIASLLLVMVYTAEGVRCDLTGAWAPA